MRVFFSIVTALAILSFHISSCKINDDTFIEESSVINPYGGIDWDNINSIPSCSHEHATTQSDLDLLKAIGVKHVALSNYYPSRPYYPISVFFSDTDDFLASPNAEHHNMSPYGSLHCNGLGSFFSSGSNYGEYPVGMNRVSWQYTFDCILQNLQFEDGGGITINHPSWSRWTSKTDHPSVEDICNMLDYDYRVLGIEFYNSTCEYGFKEKVGWDLNTWDAILKTGRRCWGFSAVDHRSRNLPGRMSGINILLCDQLDEHTCLKAYRDGCFYGALYNSSLRFTAIVLNEMNLTVSASDADYLCFIIDGVYVKKEGSVASITLPDNTTYARVEAHNSENSIYSNPILFKCK